MPVIFALLAGIIFGAGLTISDMVNPARVLNFFDITGSWDPTLLFVMGGALGTTALGYRLLFACGSPLIGSAFHLPTQTKIDAPLVGGAALFGVGWGLTGFCPGPAIAALVTLEPKVWMFVAAMLVGMVGTKVLRASAYRS
jgi:uncharacterized membrane protein YedE/YeeE